VGIAAVELSSELFKALGDGFADACEVGGIPSEEA